MIEKLLNVGSKNWDDWRWQMRQKPVCSDVAQLSILGLVDENRSPKARRIGLTPYSVKLLLHLKATDPDGFHAEMLQSFLPPAKKTSHQWVWAKRHDLPLVRILDWLPLPKFVKTLFFGKGSDTQVQALENMYPKTDVIIATAVCARHCAFCFREVGDPQGEAARMTGDMSVVLKAVNEVVARKNPHVLITGGDPLTRNNDQLKQIITPLVRSDTVEVLRLATRMVVDLPMRFFDEELLAMLSASARQMRLRNASLRIVTHINHPCELTSEAIRAIRNIQACGVQVVSQTAVFRGINDSVETLSKLFMMLDRLEVRTQKLFHSMPVEGTEHLRVPLRRFRRLLAGLHQWLPSTAVPHANTVTLVGKIPVSPSGRWIIPIPFLNSLLVRSYRGELFLFRDTYDKLRRFRETVAVAGMVLVIAGAFAFFPKSKSNPEAVLVEIKRIAVLAEALDYPDYWSRQPFKPFVQDGTLYVSLQDKVLMRINKL